jgi:hypothetical protein
MAQENHDKMNKLAKGNSCHYDHSQKATAHYELLKVVFNVQEELFCFIRISEQVGKKSTVGTYRSAKFLLKNKSTKHNK